MATNEQTGDPKCWLCACVTKPKKVYGPLICLDCLPEYNRKTFTFVRASQEELDEIFSTRRGFTCQ